MLREYRMTYYSDNREDYEKLVSGELIRYTYGVIVLPYRTEAEIDQVVNPVYSDHLDSPEANRQIASKMIYYDGDAPKKDDIKIIFPSKSFIETNSTEFGSIVGNPKKVVSSIQSIPIVVSSCETMKIVKFSVTVVQNYVIQGSTTNDFMLYKAFKDVLTNFSHKLWRIEVKTQEGDFMPPDMPLLGFDSITNVEEYYDVGYDESVYEYEPQFGSARLTSRVNHTLLFKKTITGFNILHINIFVKKATLMEMEKYLLDKYDEETAAAFVNWFVPFGLNVVRRFEDEAIGYYMMTPFIYMLVEV